LSRVAALCYTFGGFGAGEGLLVGGCSMAFSDMFDVQSYNL
jgi:hypothetical protein